MIEGFEESLGFDGGVTQKRIDRFAKEEQSCRIEVLLKGSVFVPGHGVKYVKQTRSNSIGCKSKVEPSLGIRSMTRLRYCSKTGKSIAVFLSKLGRRSDLECFHAAPSMVMNPRPQNGLCAGSLTGPTPQSLKLDENTAFIFSGSIELMVDEPQDLALKVLPNAVYRLVSSDK